MNASGLVIMLILISSCYPSSAATLNVCAEGCPYSRINEAIFSASPGDTVLVSSGTYREVVEIHENVSLQGQDSGQGRPVIQAADGLRPAVMIRASGASLDGFSIANAGGIGVVVEGDGNTVRGNGISSSRLGLAAAGQNHRITGNVLRGNDLGLLLEGEGSLVRGNLLAENGQSLLIRFGGEHTVESNLVEYSRDVGVALVEGGGNLLINNTIVRNRDGLVLMSSGNLVVGNDLSNNSNQSAFDSGSNRWDDGSLGNHYGVSGSTYAVPGGENVDRHPWTVRQAGSQLVDALKAAELIRSGVVPIDVRTGQEYHLGHLPSAKNIDIMAPDFVSRAGQLDREGRYLVYCRTGQRSLQADAILQELGFSSIYLMVGGIFEWDSEGLPLAS
ncbi:MAG TPA: NosD domain-containing protein [Methanotrichaceae archaeon]|nr:NosD domain-containing protein [Methanotrichaceae archaeon]HQF16840.1 NosD domain-containing protein [Methanotrichaceae archaeon]HQI90166.1 NosD domain-containing protein [Methanotrichaceae archaeon]HQJ29112.1 NosD domain-containing protein [Methanotrichaceae archaeon]